jgi:hypothetical protein
MENMYRSWPNMTLEPAYQDSLITLCVHVLTYLEQVLSNPKSELTNQINKINEADAACREYKVTIIEESIEDASEDDDSEGALEEQRGTKRMVEEVSAEDSDSTVVGIVQNEVRGQESPSSKRIKI